MKIRGIPQIDLFASRPNYHLPEYMSWHPEPGSCAVDSLQHSWRKLYGYAFPLFCLIGKLLGKVRKDQSLILIITPANTAMVRSSTHNVHSTSNNSTQSDHIVTRPSGAKAPFAGKQPATIGGVEGFRKALEGEGVSKLSPTLLINSRKLGSISNYQSA